MKIKDKVEFNQSDMLDDSVSLLSSDYVDFYKYAVNRLKYDRREHSIEQIAEFYLKEKQLKK